MVVVRGQPSVEKKIDTLKLREGDVRMISTSPVNLKDSNRKTFSKISTIFFNNEKGERFSIKIDSLFKDSIPVSEIADAFTKSLNEQKLDIPFTISYHPEEIPHGGDFIKMPFPEDSFAGYKLQLGNAFSYLIKRISWPILFSVFFGWTNFLLFYFIISQFVTPT